MFALRALAQGYGDEAFGVRRFRHSSFEPLIFLLVEGIRRKPVDAKVEGYVHGVGFVMLMGLIVFVSVRDFIV